MSVINYYKLLSAIIIYEWHFTIFWKKFTIIKILIYVAVELQSFQIQQVEFRVSFQIPQRL